MTIYKYYFNSVDVVVIRLNDLLTYHMVLQLYTLLTFKCITILVHRLPKGPLRNQVYRL